MEQAASRSARARTPSHLHRFVGVGAAVVLLVFVTDQVLPRLSGSADPSLLGHSPWASSVFRPIETLPTAPSLVLVLSLGLLGGLCGCYAAGLCLARSMPASRTALVLGLVTTGLACTSFVMSPPTKKADIFYYAFQGRMIVRDGINPYLVSPRAVEEDSWFPLLSPTWRDLTTGYGPAALLMSSAIDLAVDRDGAIPDVTRMVLALRGSFAGLTVGNVILIWLILGQTAPTRRLVGTLAYAWNPAVLVVGVEHNDTAMLFLALLGIWLNLRRHPTLAVFALTLSVLVKYYTLPLLLGFLVWRCRLERAGSTRFVTPIVALATFVLLSIPFDPIVVVPRIPTYLVESGRLAHLAQPPLGLILGLGAILGVRFARITSAHRVSRVIEDSALALFIYLIFLSRDWFPWYLVTAIGLATLIGGWWVDVAATVGGSWLLGQNQGTAYLAAMFQQRFGIGTAMSVELLLFGPALAAGILGALWRARHWPDSLRLSFGVLALLGFTLAVELPLVGHWTDPPPLADLGGGRLPGPIVFGTTLEWDDWSRGVKVDQIGTPSGPNGSRSLCVTFGSIDGAFVAHHPGYSTRDDRWLTLDLDRFGTPPSSLMLMIRGSSGNTLGETTLESYVSSTDHGAWQHARIPLSTLGASNTTVTGVSLASTTESGSRHICVQDLEFTR